MIEKYKFSADYYRVSVNVDPDKTQSLIDAAVRCGVKRVFIVRGRGVLHKNKVGFLTLPGISPSYDIISMVVPGSVLNFLLSKLTQVGKLDHFGAGSVFATKIDNLWFDGTELFSASQAPAETPREYDFQKDLVAINCICQLEHAEEIAHAAMVAGSPSPTINYGYGHGIRDRLGSFLQLTINPKKEFIQLVVGTAEAERIFEEMVEAGHLDKPAQGFIYTHPVQIGLINTVSYQETSPYPATMEQIIKAIDQMQGNTRWRSTGTVHGTAKHKRKKLTNLVSLNCIVNRGFGDVCSLAAMEAGAGGTSTCFANAVPLEKQPQNAFDLSDEREMISLTIGQNQVEKVADAIASVSDLAGTPVVLFTYPAPEAVTYLK